MCEEKSCPFNEKMQKRLAYLADTVYSLATSNTLNYDELRALTNIVDELDYHGLDPKEFHY